jgi:antitoxin (DNA-binding transcriptional repressor) of toxin-antitoxin stability system
VLQLTAADFVTATGRHEELGELLRSAVTARWQAYTRPVAKLVPLERRRLQDVLEQLHSDYRAMMVSTLNRSTGGPERAGADREAGREFLDGIVERFWETAQA